MGPKRYQYYNALSQVQLQTQCLQTSKSSSPLSTPHPRHPLPPCLEKDSGKSEGNAAYLLIEQSSKRPITYEHSKASFKQTELKELQQQGTNYASSSDYAQFLQQVYEGTENEEQALRCIREARSHRVYLANPSLPKTTHKNKSRAIYESLSKQPRSNHTNKHFGTQMPLFGCSIDQLSNIEDKDTLSLEDRTHYQETTPPQEHSIQRHSNMLIQQAIARRQVSKDRAQPLIVIEDSHCEPTRQRQRYPQARRSPLHNRNLNNKASKERQVTPTKPGLWPIQGQESHTKQDWRPAELGNSLCKSSLPRFVNYEQLTLFDSWHTRRGKENQHIQHKNKQNFRKPQRREESLESLSRSKVQSPCEKGPSIYDIDFKVTKPASSQKWLDSRTSRQELLTPKKERQVWPQRNNFEARDGLEWREKSSCSRSVSRGKLSVVSASRRKLR